jgi:hypothetical protein
MQAEVFGLNNLLVALMLYTFILFCNKHAEHYALVQSRPSKTTIKTEFSHEKESEDGEAGLSTTEVDGAAAKKAADTPFLLPQVLHYGRLGAFICGLALSNQHTTALYVAPIAVWVIYSLQYSLTRSALFVELLRLGVCGLCGLLPYLHLPIAAHQKRMVRGATHSTI